MSARKMFQPHGYSRSGGLVRIDVASPHPQLTMWRRCAIRASKQESAVQAVYVGSYGTSEPAMVSLLVVSHLCSSVIVDSNFRYASTAALSF